MYRSGVRSKLPMRRQKNRNGYEKKPSQVGSARMKIFAKRCQLKKDGSNCLARTALIVVGEAVENNDAENHDE